MLRDSPTQPKREELLLDAFVLWGSQLSKEKQKWIPTNSCGGCPSSGLADVGPLTICRNNTPSMVGYAGN